MSHYTLIPLNPEEPVSAKSLPETLELDVDSSALCFYRFSQFVYEILGAKKNQLLRKDYATLDREIEKALDILVIDDLGTQEKQVFEKKKQDFMLEIKNDLLRNIYKTLENQLVGSVCYGDDNRPISSLDPYEAQIIYQLRRVPGFPKTLD